MPGNWLIKHLTFHNVFWRASQVALILKNPPANAADIRDMDSFPGTGRSPGGGGGNPLQYSCLENPMDRGARWATVQRVTKSQIWWKLQYTRTQYLLKEKSEVRATVFVSGLNVSFPTFFFFLTTWLWAILQTLLICGIIITISYVYDHCVFRMKWNHVTCLLQIKVQKSREVSLFFSSLF